MFAAETAIKPKVTIPFHSAAALSEILSDILSAHSVAVSIKFSTSRGLPALVLPSCQEMFSSNMFSALLSVTLWGVINLFVVPLYIDAAGSSSSLKTIDTSP